MWQCVGHSHSYIVCHGIHLVCQDWVSQWTGSLSSTARLASESEDLPVSMSSWLGLEAWATKPGFLNRWVLGTELKPSCLHTKRFINWAIFQVTLLVFRWLLNICTYIHVHIHAYILLWRLTILMITLVCFSSFHSSLQPKVLLASFYTSKI